MSEITFRKATLDDILSFIEIEKKAKTAHPDTYSGILTEEEARKEIENCEVYLIFRDGQVVGSTEYETKGPDEAYLSGLAIDPAFEGQGLARKAIEFRLNKLKDKKKLWLVTHPENSKIIHLYQTFGFKIGERKENYYGDGQPRIILFREL